MSEEKKTSSFVNNLKLAGIGVAAVGVLAVESCKKDKVAPANPTNPVDTTKTQPTKPPGENKTYLDGKDTIIINNGDTTRHNYNKINDEKFVSQGDFGEFYADAGNNAATYNTLAKYKVVAVEATYIKNSGRAIPANFFARLNIATFNKDNGYQATYLAPALSKIANPYLLHNGVIAKASDGLPLLDQGNPAVQAAFLQYAKQAFKDFGGVYLAGMDAITDYDNKSGAAADRDGALALIKSIADQSKALGKKTIVGECFLPGNAPIIQSIAKATPDIAARTDQDFDNVGYQITQAALSANSDINIYLSHAIGGAQTSKTIADHYNKIARDIKIPTKHNVHVYVYEYTDPQFLSAADLTANQVKPGLVFEYHKNLPFPGMELPEGLPPLKGSPEAVIYANTTKYDEKTVPEAGIQI